MIATTVSDATESSSQTQQQLPHDEGAEVLVITFGKVVSHQVCHQATLINYHMMKERFNSQRCLLSFFEEWFLTKPSMQHPLLLED